MIFQKKKNLDSGREQIWGTCKNKDEKKKTSLKKKLSVNWQNFGSNRNFN